ncbi:hypothetical protein, partial [Clostridium sp.]|uniref:hypothetical protein n=1 Tax=Clostridium sp. TaxID=1506 RepID=UPI002911E4D3
KINNTKEALMEYIIGINKAAEILKMDKQALRIMLRQKRCSFGIAYKSEDSTEYTYRIDSQALERCVKGEQNFFY